MNSLLFRVTRLLRYDYLVCFESWDSFWTKRRGRFVRYPVLTFRALLDELGASREQENVIFAHG